MLTDTTPAVPVPPNVLALEAMLRELQAARREQGTATLTPRQFWTAWRFWTTLHRANEAEAAQLIARNGGIWAVAKAVVG